MNGFTLVKKYDNGLNGYMKHASEGLHNRKVTLWILTGNNEHISSQADTDMQAWRAMDKVAVSYGATYGATAHLQCAKQS